MKIAFIGLGVMGRPMAGHLIAAGHDVRLNRVKSASQHLVDAGGLSCATAAEAADGADAVIIMVPDTPDVGAVLFGEGGASQTLRGGALVIDMSSISPSATKEFAGRLADKGIGYLDAPVSGGEVGAKSGKLTIMAGGSKTDFDRARPLLEIMGGRITHVGKVGAGQTTKVANQIVVGLTIQAVAEALTFARASGADPAKVREALLGGFADSTILKVHGERMIDRSFEPGFRLRLHQKDMDLAVSGARALNIALPNTATVAQMMNAAVGAQDGEKDHSALIEGLERLSGAC